jgi:phosphoglycolate phosphatase
MRTILFDLDGTLTDPADGITRSIAYALDKLGHPSPPLTELHQYIGPPLRKTFLTLLGTTDTRVAENAVALYRERFADTGLFENRVYDGIPELLAALVTQPVRVSVATSKPHVYARRIAHHFGFTPFLTEVFGPELDGTRDSKLEVVQHAVKTLAADPDQTWMVGDRAVDIEAARALGLTSVGVLYGYGSHDELSTAAPRHLCATVSQLHSILQQGA